MKKVISYYFLTLLVLVSFLSFSGCSDDGRDSPGPVIETLPAAYHDLTEINEVIDDLEATYPSIVMRGSSGTSVEGRDIPAIIISDNPENREESEPRVKLVGGVHGNEIFSIELMVRFALYLAENYNTDSTIKGLVDSRYIVIIPVLNPDGFNAGIRYNGNGIDLNRNCSVIYQGEEKFVSSYFNGEVPFSEPEVQALRDYTLGMNGFAAPFHLSATFHSGAIIVNVPFDFAVDETAAPVEYDTVQNFGRAYSTTGNPPFKDQAGYLIDNDIIDGIINGGDWYVATGTIQDWHYLSAGCLDITIELTNDKAGPDTEEGIGELFDYNRTGLLAYIDNAGRGISGTVTDGTDPLEGVSVYIKDGDQNGDLVTKTDTTGYFHKIYFPDTFPSTVKLVFEKTGYGSKEVEVTVSDSMTPLNGGTITLLAE